MFCIWLILALALASARPLLQFRSLHAYPQTYMFDGDSVRRKGCDLIARCRPPTLSIFPGEGFERHSGGRLCRGGPPCIERHRPGNGDGSEHRRGSNHKSRRACFGGDAWGPSRHQTGMPSHCLGLGDLAASMLDAHFALASSMPLLREVRLATGHTAHPMNTGVFAMASRHIVTPHVHGKESQGRRVRGRSRRD